MTLSKMEEKKSALIKEISRRDKSGYGHTLLDFMDEYNINNLTVATVSQLEAYLKKLNNAKDSDPEF